MKTEESKKKQTIIQREVQESHDDEK